LIQRVGQRAGKPLRGAAQVWNKGAGLRRIDNMRNRILACGLTLLLPGLLAGCGSGTGRTSGTAAGGAATGAVIGIVGGPIGVVVGAGIGAGVGALSAANTTPRQVNLGNAPWQKPGQ
jgi:hypothetical protein